jgi:hypothetical protein
MSDISFWEAALYKTHASNYLKRLQSLLFYENPAAANVFWNDFLDILRDTEPTIDEHTLSTILDEFVAKTKAGTYTREIMAWFGSLTTEQRLAVGEIMGTKGTSAPDILIVRRFAPAPSDAVVREQQRLHRLLWPFGLPPPSGHFFRPLPL